VSFHKANSLKAVECAMQRGASYRILNELEVIAINEFKEYELVGTYCHGTPEDTIDFLMDVYGEECVIGLEYDALTDSKVKLILMKNGKSIPSEFVNEKGELINYKLTVHRLNQVQTKIKIDNVELIKKAFPSRKRRDGEIDNLLQEMIAR
jgi:hypothetical protein